MTDSKPKKEISGNWVSIGIIVAAFTALYFLPPLFHKTSFSLNEGGAPSAVSKFDLDRKFAVLKSSGTEKPGTQLSLGDLLMKEETLIINFWATWCPPCVEELPSLEDLNRQLSKGKAGSPKLVLISVDERVTDVENLYKTLNFKPSFLVLHDSDGAFADQVGSTKFPETYWIDRQGQLLYKWIGPQNWLSGEVVKKLAEHR